MIWFGHLVAMKSKDSGDSAHVRPKTEGVAMATHTCLAQPGRATGADIGLVSQHRHPPSDLSPSLQTKAIRWSVDAAGF